MNRTEIEARLTNPVQRDYGVYLNAHLLLQCQKPFDQLCNPDELQFQIVHQVEELWMKLIAYSLLDAHDAIVAGAALKAITLLDRVNQIMRLMIDQLDLLETMSPKDYQSIRLQLGNGSGQESPGFSVLLEQPAHLWATYKARYLDEDKRTLHDIYDHDYRHDEAYLIAEKMLDYDELFQKFRAHHIFLINRSIGMGANSLKGRSVDLLQAGVRHRFFPALWDVRSAMTDAWGQQYGQKRASISDSAQ